MEFDSSNRCLYLDRSDKRCRTDSKLDVNSSCSRSIDVVARNPLVCQILTVSGRRVLRGSCVNHYPVKLAGGVTVSRNIGKRVGINVIIVRRICASESMCK